MKLLVETTGPFMLHCYESNTSIEAHRPTVVEPTQFVSHRISIGHIKTLAQVHETATDEAFTETLAAMEGDTAAAVASFISQFPPDGVLAEQPTTDAPAAPATGGRGKKKGEQGGDPQ